MEIVRNWRALPKALRGGVYAIGNFDGVHRGHRALIDAAISEARRSNAPAAALTFEPHPRAWFFPDTKLFRLTPLPVKLDLLAEAGLDATVVAQFDAELVALDPPAFAKQVLHDALGASGAVIGEDFVFGKGRAGNAEVLARLGEELGFGVTAVRQLSQDGVVSSSRIREALREGRMQEAAALLGYWWRVRGKVARGAGRGAGLGAPTVNIALPEGQDLRRGVYAARVRVGEDRYDGAAYYGGRPTFDDGPALLETTLFEFDGDLYGKEIDVELIAHLRDDAKFENGAALAEQMQRDCAAARAVLAGLE